MSLEQRSTYRHGDLRQALVDAGLAMARESGPDAVVLREATRQVGVSPNAAYRHFADRTALLEAVSSAALAMVAGSIENEWRAIDRSGTPAEVARAELEAVGHGYIRFAWAEPGLFRTAFTVPEVLDEAPGPWRAGPGGRTAYELLETALADMVAAGVLPPERRLGADMIAWAAMHGLATLVLEGPMRGLDEETRQYVTEYSIAMVMRGLTGSSPGSHPFSG